MADEKNNVVKEKKTHADKAANKKDLVKKEKPAKKAETKKAPVKKEKKQKQEVKKVIVDKTVDPFETIQFVLMTEKCVRMIESQNKLVFVVRRTSDKKKIRKAVENAFQSPVSHVTTMIDQKGRKRAFIRFSQSGAAGDIAIRLGII